MLYGCCEPGGFEDRPGFIVFRFHLKRFFMLAYRHAFHAGNHADVLKHIVFTALLRYMNGKDKPYRVIDTHAGAGGYALKSGYAQKKGEFETGVTRVLAAVFKPTPEAPQDDLTPSGSLAQTNRSGGGGAEQATPELVLDYIERVRQFNPAGRLDQYPGSPAFAQMLLRSQDQLRLYELHPTDYKILASYVQGTRGAMVHHADGFKGLQAELPPSSRRALVLIDPSYELDADYVQLVAALRDAIMRFANGVYMVWYPLVSAVAAAELPRRLTALAPKSWLHLRMNVKLPDEQGYGLMGSGVFVINPPYTLHEQMQTVLPWLTSTLAQYKGAHFRLDQRAI
jgi:23S rRNA (adenine2030-N6)-methyltransferase